MIAFSKKGVTLGGWIPAQPSLVIYIIASPIPEAEAKRLSETYHAALFFIGAPDWNRQLTPWPAPAVFRGQEDFSGGADGFLTLLAEEIFPAAERSLPCPLPRSLCGISLGGLFALYSACQCDLFSSAASISGSLWYDRFLPFLESHLLSKKIKRVYLSLGTKEKHARNNSMARVEENTRAAYQIFLRQPMETRFEMNPGGHFADPVPRLERAFAFLSGKVPE